MGFRGFWGLQSLCEAGEKRRPPSSTLRAQRRAELLVDADSQSVELVRAAMERLQEEGLAVRTSIFAAPDLSKNKKWNALFSEPGVDFHGVARNASAIGEANDIAIRSKCKELMRSKHSERLALLAADLDFLGTLQRLARCGIQVMLFVLSNNYALIHKYRAAGIPVVELASPNERVSRVRATVHPNGSGQVALADPYYLQDCLEEVELCHAFLQDLGYVQAGSHEYLIHAACKFWRRNRLGQLTVFPQQCAIKEVCRVASEHGYRKWLKFAEDSALLIPIYSRSRLTKKQLSTYGSGLARQVFRGGGPFMLKDSKGIVHVALRKLGYLDDELSADLAEAMLAFVNAPENHYALRKKLDLLPVIDDTAMDTEEKLRQAFMSHLSAGRWRILLAQWCLFAPFFWIQSPLVK